MPENDKITRLRSNDLTAWELLVHEHYDAVFRLLRHLSRSADDAEDLTQQTFVKAHTRIDGFRNDSAIKTWLFKIAYHEFTNWNRRRKLFFPLNLALQRREAGYDKTDAGELLLSAIHGMKAELRDAFLLCEVNGLTMEEIAEVTNSPVGSVKSRVHHARMQLRTYWEQNVQEQKYEPRQSEI